MHKEAVQFMQWVKSQRPEAFQGKKVLDVGSGDINGNNRSLFTDCDYSGNDVVAGNNVTIVSKTADLPFEDESFDTIVSTECFEHDPEFAQSFQKIKAMLKPNGFFAFTCASTGRAEHGTRRTSKQDSFATRSGVAEFQDHYRNITFEDLDVSGFSHFSCYYHPRAHDLYFWAVKDADGIQAVYPQATIVKSH